MTSVARRVLALAVAALALAGCTPKDRMSIRTVDGVLEIAMCDPGKSNVIEVAVDGTDRWRASTEAEGDFLTGTLSYGELPPGYRHDLAPEPFDAQHAREIVIEFRNEVDGTGVGSYIATFDGTRLIEGRWLDQDGAQWQDGCS